MHITRSQWLRLAPLLTLMMFCCGCSTTSDERGTRAAVRGAILLDGQPLDRARVVFRSAEGENKVTATGSVVEGFYEIPAERGPLTGKMRVEIQPETIELEEFEAIRGGDPTKRVDQICTVDIPAEYNTKSSLVVNVKEEGLENKFDFHLETEK